LKNIVIVREGRFNFWENGGRGSMRGPNPTTKNLTQTYGNHAIWF